MIDIKKNAYYTLDTITAKTGPITPVIVSGFWRSGTTWLQELTAQAIGAKTIFEPFDLDSFMPFLSGKDVTYRGYIPPSFDVFSPQDRQALDRAFAGISPCRSGFNYLCRTGYGETRKRTVVVKFVRGQLVLADLIAAYTPKASLHVARHPMAVVRSMLKANWNWSFDDIDFTSFYGTKSKTETPATESLYQMSQTAHLNTACKVAALWAITERAVRETPQVTFCTYEDLVSAPETAFPALLGRAGLAIKKMPDFYKDSPVTVSDRKGISTQDRLHAWRKDFTAQELAEIRAVIKDNWPDVDDIWDLE